MAEANGIAHARNFPLASQGSAWARWSASSRSTSRRRCPRIAELAVIGKPMPRQNGRAKVTGADPFHGRHRAARHAAGTDFALAVAARAGPCHRRFCGGSRHPGVRAVLARRAGRTIRRLRSCAMSARRWPRSQRFPCRGGRGAAPHPRRLRAAAVRRGYGHGARADRAHRL